MEQYLADLRAEKTIFMNEIIQDIKNHCNDRGFNVSIRDNEIAASRRAIDGSGLITAMDEFDYLG